MTRSGRRVRSGRDEGAILLLTLMLSIVLAVIVLGVATYAATVWGHIILVQLSWAHFSVVFFHYPIVGKSSSPWDTGQI